MSRGSISFSRSFSRSRRISRLFTLRDQTVIALIASLVDLFNLAVYTQPFLWLILYNDHHFGRIDQLYFRAFGLILAEFIALFNIRIGHYPPDILAQYVLMVVVVAHLFRDQKGLKPFCLAFLIVFVNSYVWEFPIHVLDFITNRNLPLQVIQGLHLAPLLFYHQITGIDWKRALIKNLDNLILVWAFVLGSAYLRFTNPQGLIDFYLMHLNRYASLIVCLFIFSPNHSTVSKNKIQFLAERVSPRYSPSPQIPREMDDLAEREINHK